MPNAAPVIGSIIIGLVTPSTFVAPLWLPTALGSLFLAGTAYGASSLLLTLTRPTFTPSAQKQTIRAPTMPRRRIYGRGKYAGVLAFLEVRTRANFSVSGSAPHLHSLIMLAAHEIDAIEEYWLGDQQVTLNGSNLVNEDPFFTVGVRRAKLVAQLGTDGQTAHTDLTSTFPGVWTTDHRLRGIANLLGIFKSVEKHNFTKVFPDGIPQMRVVLRGAKVWDPRDVGQDPDDPTTWTWTQNAALIIMDYLWHADGLRLPRSLIELAITEWEAAADACEVQIDLAEGGTEDRFRLSGMYEVTTPPRDVLPLLLDPIGGMNCLKMRGDGAIVLEMPDYYEPDVVLTADHILSFDNLRRGPEAPDLRNEIRARYVDPTKDYEEQEAEPWRDAGSIAIDGVQSHTMDLTWCPSHAQARRRMKLEAYRLNPEWVGTIVTNAYGLNCLGERLIRVQLDDALIDDVFEVTSFTLETLAGRCVIGIRSMPEAAFSWNADTEEGEEPGFGEATGDSPPDPEDISGEVEESDL